MPELAHDEELRRLQRIAYGAVASDAERAAAAAKLEALRRGPHDDETSAGAAAGVATAPVPLPAHAAVESADAAVAAASARRFRWAIAAGTAALLIGMAVGWQLGTRTHTASAPVAAEQALAALDVVPPGVPIEATALSRLFERDPTPADAPTEPMPGSDGTDIDPLDYRLLLTRVDGVALRVARIDGGKNVCVVMNLASGGSASSCTTEGVVPATGLWIEYDGGGGSGPVRGTILPDGSAQITPVGDAGDGVGILTG